MAEALPILTATIAVTQVPPRPAVCAHAAPVGEGEVGADLVARRVAGLGGLHEAQAGAHQERLDRRDADVVGLGELGVAQALELAHEQGRALLLGQPPHIGHQPAQVLAPLGLLEGVGQRRPAHVVHVGRGRRRPAQLIDAAVVRDAVQPRAQGDRTIVGPHGAVGTQEDVLQRVLGVGARAGQHLPHISEQALPVTIVDDPKGLVVAGPEQRHQLVVGPQPKERRVEGDATDAQRCLKSRGFH